MRALGLLILCAGSLMAATTRYVIIAGLGGEPDYDTRFVQAATDLQKVFQATTGDKEVASLFGPAATKDALQKELARIAAVSKPEDDTVLILIGHGTFDNIAYKFNVPGPDITTDDLRLWLDRIPGRQLVVNTTSSSGGSLAGLRRQNRVVVTATRSGNERLATYFARYFVEALRDDSADTDKNSTVSALEAFVFADQRTARFYENQKRVVTEHALLEDTGRGDGVRAPSPQNGQGLLAARIALLRVGDAAAAMRSPEKQKLYTRKEEVEQQIDQLKYQKAAMPQDEYRKKLSALLLELARIQEEIDQ